MRSTKLHAEHARRAAGSSSITSAWWTGAVQGRALRVLRISGWFRLIDGRRGVAASPVICTGLRSRFRDRRDDQLAKPDVRVIALDHDRTGRQLVVVEGAARECGEHRIVVDALAVQR